MTDRCEPPEHLHAVEGWYWLQSVFHTVADFWIDGGWQGATPEEIGLLGYRCLGPVATIEEVSALRAELEDWRAVNEALRINANQPAIVAVHNARELRAERTRLRARVAELEAVIERLGSSEAFVLAGPIEPELRARIEYARAALEEKS